MSDTLLKDTDFFSGPDSCSENVRCNIFGFLSLVIHFHDVLGNYILTQLGSPPNKDVMLP
jgi:hypothetical protein